MHTKQKSSTTNKAQETVKPMQAPLLKKGVGSIVSHNGAGQFRARTFGKASNHTAFDPSRFKTQHKG